MNSSQLDYFEKTYAQRSYAAAARLVPMSAQGLSKAVHTLEQELGVELFTPDPACPSQLLPTIFADALLGYCRDARCARTRLMEQIEALRHPAAETLYLACAIGAQSMLGMDFPAAFERSYRHLSLNTCDLPDLKVEQALLEGSCTLGITVLPGADTLCSQPLASCERWLWMHAQDPLAELEQVDIQGLSGRNVALVGPPFKNYSLLMNALRQSGVQVADIQLSSEMIWLYNFAREARGVAFTARSVVEHYPADPNMTARPFSSMPYQIGISWLRSHKLSPGEKTFVQYCHQTAQASGYGV